MCQVHVQSKISLLWCPDGLTFLSEELFLLHPFMHTLRMKLPVKYMECSGMVAILLHSCWLTGPKPWPWHLRILIRQGLFDFIPLISFRDGMNRVANFYSSLFHPVHPIKKPSWMAPIYPPLFLQPNEVTTSMQDLAILSHLEFICP